MVTVTFQPYKMILIASDETIFVYLYNTICWLRGQTPDGKVKTDPKSLHDEQADKMFESPIDNQLAVLITDTVCYF